MTQSWSIVIFGYNERQNLPGVFDKVQKVLSQISPQDSQIILVDDGSEDGSQDVIRRWHKDYPDLSLGLHPKNRGIGHALRTGYELARCENVVAVPADGQFDIEELIPHAVLPENTLLSFYRQQKTGYSGYRHLLSNGNRWLNQWLLGVSIRDINWVKVYKREPLQALQLKLTSPLVETEIMAKLLWRGFHVEQVPSKYLPRVHGVAKGGSLKTLSKAAQETSRLILEVLRDRRQQL